MKYLLWGLLLMCTYTHGNAQTKEFVVTGYVQQEKSFSITSLQTLPVTSFQLNNGEPDTLNVLKGILLKNILDQVAFRYENSRALNRYYFVLEAEDGYKVTFSFNEIYNTEVGDQVFLVTDNYGNPVTSNGFKIITLSDRNGNARNVKGLIRISVRVAP